MDYAQLRVEFAMALRGKRSRHSLNTKLNYSYDKIAVWEKRSGTMLWDEFVAYVKLLEIPLKEVLHEHLVYTGPISNGNRVVHYLTKGHTPDEISGRSGIPVHRVRRILLNLQPKVEEILAIIDQFHFRDSLLLIISRMTGASLPIFERESIKSRDYLNLSNQDPVYGYCMALLSHRDITSGKVAAPEFIAKKIGCLKSDVKKKLDDLVSVGVVEVKGGIYICDPTFRAIGHSSEEVMSTALKYNEEYARVLKLGAGNTGQIALASFSVMLSDDAFEKMQQELRRTMFELMKIIDADRIQDNGTRYTVLSLGLFDPTVGRSS